MEDHIGRILKMLEDGRISASDAQSLIAALQTAKPEETTPAAGSPAGAKSSSPPVSDAEPEKSHNFDFEWSRPRGLPIDFSVISKTISDATRKFDADKLFKAAKVTVTRGNRRWQDRLKNWTRILEGDEGAPSNEMGLPTSRASETRIHELGIEDSVRIDNSYGSISIEGGHESVELVIEKEAWNSSPSAAEDHLRLVQVESVVHQNPASGSKRLDIRVSADEAWSDGLVHLKLRIPNLESLRANSVFGKIDIQGLTAKVEVQTVTGKVELADIAGDVRVDGISSEVRADHVSGAVRISTKSGHIIAEGVASGGEFNSASGDISISEVPTGKILARSWSGDVSIVQCGQAGDLSMTLESVSGDVSVTETSGESQVKTVSGDSHLNLIDAETINITTTSGDVRIEISKPYRNVANVTSLSGDVSIVTPAESGYRFTLGSGSGKIRSSEDDIPDSSRMDTLRTGVVGDGSGTVTVQTRSGDVVLRAEGVGEGVRSEE